MRKVIVLGAGGGQLPLVRICKQRGFYVLAVGLTVCPEVADLADEIFKADIRDKGIVLQLARREGICGILTDQVDVSVQTVAYVSEELGLPSIGSDTSVRFTDKRIMRASAAALGIPQPRYACAGNGQEAEEVARRIGFPCVIKPADSDGSKGVSIVREAREITTLYRESLGYSTSGQVLLEQYLRGDLYEVQGFVQSGRYTALCISKETHFDMPGVFVPNTNIYCSAIAPESAVEKHIMEIDKKLIEGFGLPFGITQSEYLHDCENGRTYLIETAARGGGMYISSHLIPMACGVDANGLLVSWSTRPSMAVEPLCLMPGASGYLCFALPQGVIRSVEGLEAVRALEGVREVFLEDVRLGGTTRQLRDKRGRYGPILVTGQDREACRRVICRVRELLKITVSTQEGEKGIIW